MDTTTENKLESPNTLFRSLDSLPPNYNSKVISSSSIKTLLKGTAEDFLNFQYTDDPSLSMSLGNLFEELILKGILVAYELDIQDPLNAIPELGEMEYIAKFINTFEKFLEENSERYQVVDSIPIPSSEGVKTTVEYCLNHGITPLSDHERVLEAAHANNYLTNYKDAEKLAKALWDRYGGRDYYNYLFTANNAEIILTENIYPLFITSAKTILNLKSIIDDYYPLDKYYTVFNPRVEKINLPNNKLLYKADLDVLFIKKFNLEHTNQEFPYLGGVVDIKLTTMSPIQAYHTFNMKYQGAFYYGILSDMLPSDEYSVKINYTDKTNVLLETNEGIELINPLEELAKSLSSFEKDLIYIQTAFQNDSKSSYQLLLNSSSNSTAINESFLKPCLPPIFLFGKLHQKATYSLIMNHQGVLSALLGSNISMENEVIKDLFSEGEFDFSNNYIKHTPGIINLLEFLYYSLTNSDTDLTYREYYHQNAGI